MAKLLQRLTLCLLALPALAAEGGDAAPAPARTAAEPAALEATLQRATQALMDAVAPGERAVWERYTDPALTYVTEDNEVKDRAAVLADLKPLPAGYSGSIVVEEFHCSDFGSFAVTTYVLDEHESIEGHELHARYRGSDTWRTSHGDWQLVAAQVYAIPQDPPRTALPGAQLADYEGSYSLSPATRQLIRREGDHLIAERDGRAPQQLLPESADVFFTPGRPRTRRIFTRGADGHVSGFSDRREGTDLTWTRLAPAAGTH